MTTEEAAVRELLARLWEDERTRESIVPRLTFASDYPDPTRLLSQVDADLWSALQEIASPNAKAEVLAVLARLPDECSVGDILEELHEREHLRRGVASAIYEPRITQEEMEAWLAEWASEVSATELVEPGEPQADKAPHPWPDESEADVSASYNIKLTKDEVIEALDDLPDDSTVEDILHRLYVREQIKQGMWSLDNEPTFTHEEVKQSLARWLDGEAA